MKTITIRLPDVEAAMLIELQRRDKNWRDIELYLANVIRGKYAQLKR